MAKYTGRCCGYKLVFSGISICPCVGAGSGSPVNSARGVAAGNGTYVLNQVVSSGTISQGSGPAMNILALYTDTACGTLYQTNAGAFTASLGIGPAFIGITFYPLAYQIFLTVPGSCSPSGFQSTVFNGLAPASGGLTLNNQISTTALCQSVGYGGTCTIVPLSA